MSQSFDRFKDTYGQEVQSSISFIGQDHDFFIEAKAVQLLKTVQARLGNPRNLSFLDVGCGIGIVESKICAQVGSVTGVDVSAGSIQAAQEKSKGTFRTYDGATLPFAEKSFDVVFSINTMHHIPPDRWSATLAEMHRILKPGGLCLIFEHNPLNPLTQLAVKRCELDKGVVLLHRSDLNRILLDNQFRDLEHRYILFFPWKSRILTSIESGLTWLPLGAQHFISGRKMA